MYEMCKQNINSKSDEVRMSVQIRELCEWRDKCDLSIPIKGSVTNYY